MRPALNRQLEAAIGELLGSFNLLATASENAFQSVVVCSGDSIGRLHTWKRSIYKAINENPATDIDRGSPTDSLQNSLSIRFALKSAHDHPNRTAA